MTELSTNSGLDEFNLLEEFDWEIWSAKQSLGSEIRGSEQLEETLKYSNDVFGCAVTLLPLYIIVKKIDQARGHPFTASTKNDQLFDPSLTTQSAKMSNRSIV